MRRVEQRGEDDCGVAVLSIVLDLEYEEVLALIGDRFDDGVSVFVLQEIIASAGWDIEHRTIGPPWPPVPFADRHVVMVNPTEHATHGHWVAMDSEGLVLDPFYEDRNSLQDYPVVYSAYGLNRRVCA